jgi:hypothetical protein
MLPASKRYISHHYSFIYHRFSLISMAGYGMPSSSRSSGSVASSFTSRYNDPALVEALSRLAINTEQRDAIAAFVQATKQSIDVAIVTLQECNWDLLEAISQLGDDYEYNDAPRDRILRDSPDYDEEDDGIEPIRRQARWRAKAPSPEPRRKSRESTPSTESRRKSRESTPSTESRRRKSRESTPSNIFLLKALEQATAKSGKDHPRSFRSVVIDPIAIDYAPLGL